jgi:hypothetical protein
MSLLYAILFPGYREAAESGDLSHCASKDCYIESSQVLAYLLFSHREVPDAALSIEHRFQPELFLTRKQPVQRLIKLPTYGKQDFRSDLIATAFDCR